MFTDIVINCRNRYRKPYREPNDVKFGMVIDFTDLKKSSKKKSSLIMRLF
jgi:hypothetical protein